MHTCVGITFQATWPSQNVDCWHHELQRRRAPKDGSGGAGVLHCVGKKCCYRHGAEKLRKQEIACVTRIGVPRWNDIAS